jgi:NTP pyrophosphatase (non-canonical NTP hydrolase)
MSEEGDFEDIKSALSTHIEGKLCENCRDLIENELGKNLFYMASICNTLDLNLYDIIIKEEERVKLLGQYNLR